jgi:hypothetical protein
MRRRAALLLLLAAWPVATARAGPAQPTVRTGAHFRVLCDFASGRAADEALSTVEAVWTQAAPLYGVADAPPSPPLEVHLYRHRAAYDAACDRLLAGKLKRNLAFAHFPSRSAHVALQPPVPDAALAARGLPYLTRNLLAHEAAHLVRFHAMAAYRDHPLWFVDGSAQWFKLQALLALGLVRSAEEDPLMATGLRRAQAVRARGALPKVARILADDLHGLHFYERYAVRQAFFAFLAEPSRRAALQRFVHAMRDAAPGADLGARMARGLAAALGDEVFGRIDDLFGAWLDARRPAWEETARSLETAGTEWTQIAFPERDARAWRIADAPGTSYAFTARVEIPGPGPGRADVLLGRRPEGFVAVRLDPAQGVEVVRRQTRGDAWQVLAHATRTFPLDRPVPLRIEVRDGHLTVFLQGASLLQVALPPTDLAGPWGLGVRRGTTALWHDVAVR